MAFQQFGHLPAELRLRVWEFALPESRTISIDLASSSTSLTATRNPILLSVSAESRSAVTTHYQPAFVTSSEARIYVDSKLDTIVLLPPCPRSCYKRPNCFECVHFSYASRLARFESSTLAHIENVTIHAFAVEGLAGLRKVFKGLKCLTIIPPERS
jgi:hypothetical protein